MIEATFALLYLVIRLGGSGIAANHYVQNQDEVSNNLTKLLLVAILFIFVSGLRGWALVKKVGKRLKNS